MRSTKQDLAIIALRWVLGIVVIAQTLTLGFNDRAIATFAHTGLPDLVRLVLVGSEAVAAILFLVSPTLVLGAWFLLAVFCGAAIIHLAHGWYDVGGLIVYAMATVVVMVHQKGRSTKPEDLYAR